MKVRNVRVEAHQCLRGCARNGRVEESRTILATKHATYHVHNTTGSALYMVNCERGILLQLGLTREENCKLLEVKAHNFRHGLLDVVCTYQCMYGKRESHVY